MSAPYAKLPGWADYGLIPLINLIVAFLVAGLVVLLVGENPFDAAVILVKGALGGGQNIAYTLYYATNFIFTGLAVAVADGMQVQWMLDETADMATAIDAFRALIRATPA